MNRKILWLILPIATLAIFVLAFVEDRTDEQLESELSEFKEFAQKARRISEEGNNQDKSEQNTSNNLSQNRETLADTATTQISKTLSLHGEYISNKWVDDIKKATGIQNDLIDIELGRLIQDKILLEENTDSRLIALVSSQGASVALMTSDDSSLTENQLSNKNELRQQVEQILAEKYQARADLENGLKRVLSTSQYEALQDDIQVKVNEAVGDYIDKFESRLNTHVSDLNDFQKSELNKVFETHRTTELKNVSIGAMINNKGGSHLLSDDPASIQFIASLQQSVQAQLSTYQLNSFMNGIRSEANNTKLGFE